MRRSDCDEIARQYNRNLAIADPLWCASGRAYDGKRIWLHRLVLAARGRGRAIGQVHERRGRVVSYFGGYARGDQVTFSIGVVDLDLPNPYQTWRQDCVHLFESALAAGAKTFRIQASSDQAWFVGWLEREVGMRRLPDRAMWTAERRSIAEYVDGVASTRAA